MSEPEGFLSRWSRRKREAEQPTPVAAAQPQDAGDAMAAVPEVPAFDPATLPPLESIGAGGDITAFLQAGVPADLSRAALRRAWSADPAIRDFVGLSENAWDFTAADGVPGFGTLAPERALQLARQLLAPTLQEPAAPEPGAPFTNTLSTEAETAPATKAAEAAQECVCEQDAPALPGFAANPGNAAGSTSCAAQYPEAAADLAAVPARRHGGALPRPP